MTVLNYRNFTALRASPSKCNQCPARIALQPRRPEVCVGVSVPDAPQVEPSSPQPTASEGAALNVTGDDARRRNDEALARVLSDFAIAKATGQLVVAEEEDEDEVEGEEGEDWVWWRAEDHVTQRNNQASISVSTSSPQTSPPSATATSPQQPSATEPSSTPQLSPTTAARAPPLRPPFPAAWPEGVGAGGRPPTVSQFRRKGPALRPSAAGAKPGAPPPPAQPASGTNTGSQ